MRPYTVAGLKFRRYKHTYDSCKHTYDSCKHFSRLIQSWYEAFGSSGIEIPHTHVRIMYTRTMTTDTKLAHTSPITETGGHIHSNSYILLNSRTKECSTLTELLRSTRVLSRHGVATTSRLLKSPRLFRGILSFTGLFCKRDL